MSLARVHCSDRGGSPADPAVRWCHCAGLYSHTGTSRPGDRHDADRPAPSAAVTAQVLGTWSDLSSRQRRAPAPNARSISHAGLMRTDSGRVHAGLAPVDNVTVVMTDRSGGCACTAANGRTLPNKLDQWRSALRQFAVIQSLDQADQRSLAVGSVQFASVRARIGEHVGCSCCRPRSQGLVRSGRRLPSPTLPWLPGRIGRDTA